MTLSRIKACFQRLAQEGRAGFIPYIMAGDPNAQETAMILSGFAESGADLIELGFPFSDPMAEGVTIQKAAKRALESHTSLRTCLDLVAGFRKTDKKTPIILMGYLNPIWRFGFDAFAKRAAEAGLDGLLIVDCPPEESAPLVKALKLYDISLIRLVTPTTDPQRLKTILEDSSGFIYYVSVTGVTGTKSAAIEDVAKTIAQVRKQTDLPIAVGFGIKTETQAADCARIADAVVVGSALVEDVALAWQDGEDVTKKVLAKAAFLAQSIRSARIGHES